MVQRYSISFKNVNVYLSNKTKMMLFCLIIPPTCLNYQTHQHKKCSQEV